MMERAKRTNNLICFTVSMKHFFTISLLAFIFGVTVLFVSSWRFQFSAPIPKREKLFLFIRLHNAHIRYIVSEEIFVRI